MGKKKYVCKQCNKEYWSYKEKSNFCSIGCKKEYNERFCYKCDNCGKEFKVPPSRLKRLENGISKHLYCCRECADKGNTTAVALECLNCGKEFSVFKSVADNSKFCSHKCCNEYKLKHSTVSIKICPICGKEFSTYHHNQKYCCMECRGKADRKRVICTCDYCGVKFEKPRNAYHSNGRNYCSDDCRMRGMFWNNEEINILIANYNGYPSCEMISNKLNGRWDKEAVYRKAIILGLTEPREWSSEDKEVVKRLYATSSIEELKDILPHKTESAIRGVAHSLGLKSMYYLNRKYSDDENEFLANNYMLKTNEELGEILNRTPGAIAQHLWALGYSREQPPLGERYRNLTHYLRAKVAPIINKLKSSPDSCCAITGGRTNLVLHHIRGFSLITHEAIHNVDLPIYPDLSDYTEQQLLALSDEFIKLHETYHQYVLIDKNIHLHFHKLYGYGYNTEAQWNEFIHTFYKS